MSFLLCFFFTFFKEIDGSIVFVCIAKSDHTYNQFLIGGSKVSMPANDPIPLLTLFKTISFCSCLFIPQLC